MAKPTARTVQISIRVTGPEKKRLAAAAKRAGLPVAGWVRMVALGEVGK